MTRQDWLLKDVHRGAFEFFITVSKTIFSRALHLPERFRHPIYCRVLPVIQLLIGQPSG